MFFFVLYGDHPDLHVLTHSFPTRRSSDLSASFHKAGPLSSTSAAGTCTSGTGAGSDCCCAQAGAAKSNALALAASVKGWKMESMQSRSEEHTSELQSLMRISYAVFCLKKKKRIKKNKQVKHMTVEL